MALLRVVLVLACCATNALLITHSIKSHGRILCLRSAAIEESDRDPESMRVGEIQAELDLRGVGYSDIFEVSELRRRLKDARLSGKADTKILDNFNRLRAEVLVDSSKKVEADKEELRKRLDAITGSDGTVPGGLRPDEVQILLQNPEIMAMLSKPDFQKIMKEAMEGGPDALAKYMNDPEMREMLQTAARLVSNAGLIPP